VRPIEYPDHAGMRESGRGPGLPLEPGDELRILRQVLVHDLQGYHAVQAQVGRLVDGGHASAAKPGVHR
jgi:hypothetical protein